MPRKRKNAGGASSTPTRKSSRKSKSQQANDNSDNSMWSGSSRSSKSKMSRKSSSSSSSSAAASGLNQAGMTKLFDDICDPDDHSVATMEGISSLCEKLDLDPLEDIRVLVLLWKLEANEKPGQISREEWMAGCKKLGADSIAKFQSLLPSLDTGFLAEREFKDFYKFCFQFNRQGTHKTLEKDLVIALMQMVLKDRIASDRLETFCAFLEGSKGYSKITLDQWVSWLDFCHECEDLSTYDEANSAWPVLIDEYVEYMEEKAKK